MIVLGSSLRERRPEDTLCYARELAKEVGITRVTDTTRLDRVGIPVFASIRPDAVNGSLCVNAGKGVVATDAMVGAYMESLEFAWAEPRRAIGDVALARFSDLLDGRHPEQSIFSLGPVAGRAVDLGAPIACMVARDIANDEDVLVPAELVLMPYVDVADTGVFGSTTNGLCSGNSEDEAALHGLFELIERDARSFQHVVDRADRVDLRSTPSVVRQMVEQIEAAGLSICIRVLPNEFGLPAFETMIFDHFSRTRSYLNGGYGAHLSRDIAIVRALTEAVQSRLSGIHGGRDDLADPYARERAIPLDVAATNAANDFASACNRGRLVSYDAVPDVGVVSIEQAFAEVCDRLARIGLKRVCRIRLNPRTSPLAVVRMLVPGLEYMQPHATHRFGPRLYEFWKRATS
jgi:ribosomal protein S12 methylthiotransferase accessory factor